ncbi:hypothetical protein [Halorussus caseinilyticus]|uniref:Uncharacterized protein n=1 Tax=Halorussus caseinilyticus TaxID=3034025 RepID=A0ABD5WKI9_9EURY
MEVEVLRVVRERRAALRAEDPQRLVAAETRQSLPEGFEGARAAVGDPLREKRGVARERPRGVGSAAGHVHRCVSGVGDGRRIITEPTTPGDKKAVCREGRWRIGGDGCVPQSTVRPNTARFRQ